MSFVIQNFHQSEAKPTLSNRWARIPNQMKSVVPKRWLINSKTSVEWKPVALTLITSSLSRFWIGQNVILVWAENNVNLSLLNRYVSPFLESCCSIITCFVLDFPVSSLFATFLLKISTMTSAETNHKLLSRLGKSCFNLWPFPVKHVLPKYHFLFRVSARAIMHAWNRLKDMKFFFARLLFLDNFLLLIHARWPQTTSYENLNRKISQMHLETLRAIVLIPSIWFLQKTFSDKLHDSNLSISMDIMFELYIWF